MPDPERITNTDSQIARWEKAQLSSIMKPESTNFNRFFVSIDHPQSTSNLFGYIEVETTVQNSGALYIPFRLSDANPFREVLGSAVEQNAKTLCEMQKKIGSPEIISEILKKPRIDVRDMADLYTAFGFPTTVDFKNGFYPSLVKGFTLNFEGAAQGDISFWMYKFRNPWEIEFSLSERHDSGNVAWKKSVQNFSLMIHDSLPFTVKPADVQHISR